jgi:hypothetical protein
MSALRLCGALARKSVVTQSKNVPLLVPVAFKVRDLTKTPFGHQQYRDFKNFGHKPTPVPGVTKLFHLFVGVTFFLCLLDWRK